MAQTEHYNFWYLDPDEEISDFPNTWNYNVDKFDAAIHEAATDNVTVARIPNLPASKTTSGTFADARIPDSIARNSDVSTGNAALDKRITSNADRLDRHDKTFGNLDTDVTALGDRLDGHGDRLDTLESDVTGHGDRLDDLEDNRGDDDTNYRSEKVEADTGDGSFSIERNGPLVFIWGNVQFDSEASSTTTIFEIPAWAQTTGLCLMPFMVSKDGDNSTAYLQVSGANAIATADIPADSSMYGSITYLTTKESGDDTE